jgi:hypothetical protein
MVASASPVGVPLSLFIDLSGLEAATAGFSDSNLLHRGGFPHL